MEDIFKIDSDVKLEYLDMKPTDTAKSEMFVLKLADEYELSEGKSIYNMSIPELKEMIATQFKNSSVKAVLKNISILKNYIDFCIGKNIVIHCENRLATFSTKEAKEFVSKQAMLNKYISKTKLKEYQGMLCNEQDQLLLELPFIGVRGRTTSDGTLEEIINLTINDIGGVSNMITLTQNDGKQRLLQAEETTIDLIRDVYKQEYYVENNGEQTNNPRLPDPKRIPINKVEHFVFRVPGSKKIEQFNSTILNSRMKRIQKYLGNPYITYTSLYFSGMLDMAMNILKNKGEVTKEDYVEICARYNYGSGDPEKYWFNLKSLFDQYKELVK